MSDPGQTGASGAFPTEERMRALLKQARERIERLQVERDEKIAVIGLAARMPGAANADEYWRLLAEGRSGLRAVTGEDLAAAGLDPSAAGDPDYVSVWGGPPDTDGFDAAFFGYAPRQAELLDPQQRMFLECAWNALEDAGHGGAQPDGLVGVYAGASLSSHLLRAAGRADAFEAGLANIGGMVAARASFHLDLKGPSVGVQTTCSSALVALHQAMQGLRAGDCDMALAGAVAVNQMRPEGYLHQKEGIASPDGVCRPFDAEAAGTVFSNGAAVVVLKRLSDALRDGDAIRGVLLGSAVNNDGAGKVGLTAPSVSGQAGALSAALAAARLGADAIDYIEAHGTATALGDPIELTALNRAYGPGLDAAGRRCALGAVKGNVGHLDAAAGMAGLVKILLAFRHERLPGTANFAAPNPRCDFGRFDLIAEARDWPRDPARPRRAGLSAFGIGGTNAHLIVEEPPAMEAPCVDERAQLLPVSGGTPEALAAAREALALALEADDAPALADAAFTLQTGRRALDERQFFTARTNAEAAAILRAADTTAARPSPGASSPVFIFSGQGSQAAGMARDLHATEPAFRDALEECLAHLPAEIRLLLLEGGDEIHQTRFTQPALFALEYALARMWAARGVRPVALLGHSIGEYAAAALAGVFDLPAAARAVTARGALMQGCEPGAMLAAMMSEAEATQGLPEGVEIAAVNGPRAVVLSGPVETVEALAARLDRSGVGARLLRTSHAFHSAMMEPALEAFREVMAGLSLYAPAVPVISNLTGDWLTGADATDPGYWVRQLRSPVRFGAGVARLMELEHPLLLEVGPGAGLIRLARQSMKDGARGVASLPEGGKTDGAAEILRATGELWAAGAPVDWAALHDGARRRVPLPGYPFERKSFWLPPASVAAEPAESADPADWFFQPVWRRLANVPGEAAARLLILGDGAARAIGAPPEGAMLAGESEGGAFSAADGGFRMDPENPDHYAALFAALPSPPDEILCGWGLGDRSDALFPGASALARALKAEDMRTRVTLLGAGMCEVTGREALSPASAKALGLAPVLAQEAEGVSARTLDLDPDELGGPVRGFETALGCGWEGARCALRGGYLWREEHEPTPMRDAPFEGRGPFLIVGDLVDGLASAFVRALREDLGGQVILAGRGLPDPSEWDAWLATHGPSDPAGEMIANLRRLGRIGSEIVILPGDETDAGWLDHALTEAETRFGAIEGVFHVSAMGDVFFAPLDEPTPEAIERRLAAKPRGLRALRRVLASRSPRFCLVQSSLSVLAGGHGFAAYAAANAAVEAEVALARRESGTVWQAVEWDAAETGSLAHLASTRVLDEAEVWRAARRVLAHPGAGLVVVTPGSLARRLTEAAAPAPASAAAAARRPDTPYVAPRDAYETAVAAAMSEMLGVPEVGAEDDFFALGGHSLLAIQVVNRLRREFSVELPVRALLYEAPTVAGVAGVIRKAREEAEAEVGLLDGLLDEIEAEREQTAG